MSIYAAGEGEWGIYMKQAYDLLADDDSRSLGVAKFKPDTARGTLERAGWTEANLSSEALRDRLIYDVEFSIELAAVRLRQLQDDGFGEKGAYLAYALSPRSQQEMMSDPRRILESNQAVSERSARYNAYQHLQFGSNLSDRDQGLPWWVMIL